MGFPVFPLLWKDPATGDTSRGYREDGHFPDAFINMLALLVGTPVPNRRFLRWKSCHNTSRLERVGKSGARFDPEKTKWFNHQYLVLKPDSELAQILLPILVSQGAKADVALAERVCAMVKERCHFVAEIWDQSFFLFKAPENHDEKVERPNERKEDVPAIAGEIANSLYG